MMFANCMAISDVGVSILSAVITAILTAVVTEGIRHTVKLYMQRANEKTPIFCKVRIKDLQQNAVIIDLELNNKTTDRKSVSEIGIVAKNLKGIEEPLILCVDQSMNLFGSPLKFHSEGCNLSGSIYLEPKSYTSISLKFESLEGLNEDKKNYFIRFMGQDYPLELTADPNKIQEFVEVK